MEINDSKTRVGILRGGQWGGYENSIKEGAGLISYVQQNLSGNWVPVDIFIDKEGMWHIQGRPVLPSDLVHRVDVAWNISNPGYSQILNDFSIPNISSSAFASTFMDSREMLEQHMGAKGVSMPRHLVLPAYLIDFDGLVEDYAIKKAKQVLEKFGAPWIVKSLTKDASMGVHVAKTFPDLVNAIIDGAEHGGGILIEELIAGKEGSIHTVKGFRGNDVYALGTGTFSLAEKEKMVNLAKIIHTHMGDSHYLKSNFIFTPRGSVYLTSVELKPDFNTNSHFSKSCEVVGVKPHNVFEHILAQALL